MAYSPVGVGTTANDGTGDPIRTAFTKTNANFVELYGPVVAVTVAASTTLALTLAHHGSTIILAGSGSTVSMNGGTLGDGFVCKIINDTGADWTVPTPTSATLRFDSAANTKVSAGGSAGIETYTRASVRYVHVAGTTI